MATTPLAARRGAALLIRRVIEDGEMLDEAALPAETEGPDRARALTLARETLRWLGSIDAVVAGFVKRPPPDRARAILRVAAAELLVLGAAAHGVVHAAVAQAKSHKKTERQAGLLNAVLRRVAEDGHAIWAGLDHPRLTTPEWLWKQLRADWGKAGARSIAEAHLRGAPLDLTVKSGAEDWAARLGGVCAGASVRLAKPGKITELEGFADGQWWAQDAAAAIPARLAGSGEGRAALDLCAAPGGKTMQLAAAGWKVTAVDADGARMKRVAENLARTDLSAELATADANDWPDQRLFDLILLDAPCTATGTIRRHPDLPHIRTGEGVSAAMRAQDALLDTALRRLSPTGTLLYCTCSLNRAEGEARVNALLKRAPDMARNPITAEEVGDPALITNTGDYRARPDLWSEIGGMDGFFASRLIRRT